MPTVLIAAHEPNLRTLLRIAVASSGREVLESEDGAAAWRVIRSRRPDLVVLDGALPGIAAMDLCRMVRADPALARLRVILILSTADTHQVQEALQAGANDWIAKPVSPNLLSRRAAWLLASPDG